MKRGGFWNELPSKLSFVWPFMLNLGGYHEVYHHCIMSLFDLCCCLLVCSMSWYFLYMYGLSFIIIFLLLSHTPTFLIVVWRSERGIYDGSRSWAINSGPPTFRWTQGSLDFHGLKAQPTPRRRSPWNLLGGLYPIFTTCNWERWNVFLLDNFQWCISKCTFDFASPDRSDKLMDGRYDK